ncbi:hypothetical protein KOW79_003283 [Hemibagrus wyckioides]|uniref:Uncharacterized protein n=1 Tax=Hemibagrus wyckioides TaxID=337641 RepID=A0A9D3P589_9TELE|nr:hypothetical protein KOW79_003283 [Hemibagrus wyckioides]
MYTKHDCHLLVSFFLHESVTRNAAQCRQRPRRLSLDQYRHMVRLLATELANHLTEISDNMPATIGVPLQPEPTLNGFPEKPKPPGSSAPSPNPPTSAPPASPNSSPTDNPPSSQTNDD